MLPFPWSSDKRRGDWPAPARQGQLDLEQPLRAAGASRAPICGIPGGACCGSRAGSPKRARSAGTAASAAARSAAIAEAPVAAGSEDGSWCAQVGRVVCFLAVGTAQRRFPPAVNPSRSPHFSPSQGCWMFPAVRIATPRAARRCPEFRRSPRAPVLLPGCTARCGTTLMETARDPTEGRKAGLLTKRACAKHDSKIVERHHCRKSELNLPASAVDLQRPPTNTYLQYN